MPETQSEVKNTSGSFDIDKALNKQGFPEFLGQFPDYKSLDLSDNSSDADTIKERYEAFTRKNEVAKELKTLYRDTINRDIGIRLPESEFACIDAFLETQAIENPSSIAEFYKDIQEFQQLPQEIASAEQTLKTLGGLDRIQEKIDATQEKLREAQDKYDVEEEKDVDGKWRGRNRRREEKGARLASIQKEIEDLQKESISYTEKIDTLDKAKDAKKEIGERSDELRLKIFEDFAPAKEILARAQKAAHDKLNVMFEKYADTDDDAKTLRQIEDVQAYFDQMTKTDGPWSYADGIDIEAHQESFDSWITLQFNIEITRAITSFTLGSSSSLEKLEKKLDSYLNKDRLGSQKGQEAKEFILQTLQQKAEQESEPAKLILLRRIIAKFATRKIA